MSPRVREQRLKMLIGDAVRLKFNSNLIEDYKIQLLVVLISIAKDKANDKAHRQTIKRSLI